MVAPVPHALSEDGVLCFCLCFSSMEPDKCLILYGDDQVGMGVHQVKN